MRGHGAGLVTGRSLCLARCVCRRGARRNMCAWRPTGTLSAALQYPQDTYLLMKVQGSSVHACAKTTPHTQTQDEKSTSTPACPRHCPVHGTPLSIACVCQAALKATPHQRRWQTSGLPEQAPHVAHPHAASAQRSGPAAGHMRAATARYTLPHSTNGRVIIPAGKDAPLAALCAVPPALPLA
jgi:hypothetical protein